MKLNIIVGGGGHETNLAAHFLTCKDAQNLEGRGRERQVYCDMLGDGIPEITMLKNNLQIASFKDKVILGGLV